MVMHLSPDTNKPESTQGTMGGLSLKTDAGKTKSNAIEVPSVSLPKGGGAIKGIDEKFSVNAVNGTAAFSVPLPVSQARGVTPDLSISYNSAGGNGIFGLGWSLNMPSIKRKTDKQLPQYLDGDDSDVFLFSDAEDLVPEFQRNNDGSFQKDNNGHYIIKERNSTDGLFTIRSFRPRIEGLFARIERWTAKNGSETKWRVITKDNITTLFGWSEQSRIADPHNPGRIYEWLPERVFDDKGNCSRYIYKKEDTINFDHSATHNQNRIKNNVITYSNTYIEKILYGNKTPYSGIGAGEPDAADFLFEIVFDYANAVDGQPQTVNNTNWNYRPDTFSNYKPGFEIRTTRRCNRVLLFHHFTGANEYDGLVKSLNITYDSTAEDFTFLKEISSHGYIRLADDTYSEKHLPPMEFTYQPHEWNTEVKTIAAEDVIHAPSGLDEPAYQFTDLYNEGLSGILTEQANGWYYKYNLSKGKFAAAKLVSPKPSFAGLGVGLQLADLDADGGKQLVSYKNEPSGFFELNDDNEWEGLRSFFALPNVDFSDANTRMLDLNGDGRAELLISEDNVFTWYASEGRGGFSPAVRTQKLFDEEAGPTLVFAETAQTIFLADMSGSGMTDLVRIRNGEVCYWPNLGFGKFGAKVTMDHAPFFDAPDAFNPAYIRLADIDGSGTTDIIYAGKNTFTCYRNLSGNRFAAPFQIAGFPEIHNHSKITVTDILGNGVACIVWSSSLAKDANAPLKYIDLMNSKKPHIMVGYKNNMGKEVSLEYTPSTTFYIDDKNAGKPWVTKLHFPVHCVSKTIVEDRITGHKFTSSYKYHHGYYDHPEKEFRGFGMVEQTDSEDFEHWIKSGATNITQKDLHQPPVTVKTWFHTGAFLRKDKILSQFENDYWYEEMKRKGIAVVHHEAKLPDARLVIPAKITGFTESDISATEWREAARSCKGMPLRKEIFSYDAPKENPNDDEIKRENTPYSVSTHNCVIELLQPKGKNQYAIFIVKENEALAYNYEREIDDPRIAHNLNVKLDEYGNVLESAAVVYPRLAPDLSLPAETREEQSKTVVIYTENHFTNDFNNDPIFPDTHRLPLPSETKTYQLRGVQKTNTFYTAKDFDNILAGINSDTAEYFETDKPLTPGKAQRRLIEHIRSTYYRNDLTAALPLHQLGALAIPFESYQLAYTPALVNDIYTGKVNDGLLTEGKFTHSEGDANWWIRSGTIQFIQGAETAADAKNRFYSPLSYTDAFGAVTKVKYHGNYFLFIVETEDALGNKTGVDTFNFRTLSPQKMRDINGNLSEAISDELGLVKAVALLGKGNEADELTGLKENADGAEIALLQNFFTAPDTVQLTATAKNLLQRATSRFVYDLDAYINQHKPVVVAMINREQHFQKNANSPVQMTFEYTSGIGKTVMKKVQAEPGPAKQVTVNEDNTIVVTEIDTSTLNPKQLRWIGNGKTILNNKGNAVKQYEPYFSVSPRYENFKELVETGVTPVMYYDAIGRLIKTAMPDGSFSKVAFDSWKQVVFDANDTVLESDWYLKRTDTARPDFITDAAEQEAAAKAMKHADTPNTLHFDTFGRQVLSVEHNKNIATEADEFYRTKVKLDAEGNLRSVTDAREIAENGNTGNMVMLYKYDMLGNMVYQNSMDAGQRWLLQNVTGKPIRTWDERDHEFQYAYDVLQRPIQSKVLGGDGGAALDNIFNRIIYGESLLLANRTNEAAVQVLNILGKPIKTFDTGGMLETPEYDFKGAAKTTSRKLFKNYKAVANWTDANLVSDLEGGVFTFANETDALGRITQQIAPDGSIITPAYNEAGLLNSETVLHPGTNAPVVYIKDIHYNEKGQRNKIIYGNDVSTKFYYDKQTFRLRRLETLPVAGGAEGGLQDWYYTYDPVGNITHIEDKNIPVVFFNNQKITGIAAYTYDALYRLAMATGRENDAALTFTNEDNWNDAPFMQSHNPGDPMAMRNYTQSYRYDAVGNITQMKHVAGGNHNWTRNYAYETSNNRLQSTQVGDIANPINYTQYTHHAQHGFLMELPHLDEIAWNFKEELIKSIRQKVNPGNGNAETTYYQYDGSGQRIRKITENAAAVGAIPTIKEERIYVEGYETYRTYSTNAVDFERNCLSLLDQSHRFVMIETVLKNEMPAPSPSERVGERLSRYQLHNHLGSAALELDATAQVISYEEYRPYGTTAYQAKNNAIKSTAKRYRYTGMERDEETGLEYHSARYYMPWLGRWMSCDPIGIGDGVNVYGYTKDNPVKLTDRMGSEARLIIDEQAHTITVNTTVHLYAATRREEQRLRNVSRQAESFYQNPVVATDQEVSQAQAAGTAIPSRGTNFTDAGGQAWTIRFDVHYQVHRATTPVKQIVSQSQGSTLYEVSTSGVQRDSLQVGDNTMTLVRHSQKTIGGVVDNASIGSIASNATGELYYEQGLPDAALSRRLIHETGHFIGFDERYDPVTASFARGGYAGFDSDFMGADDDSSSRTIAINPVHIEELGQFAMSVRTQAGIIPTGTTSRTFLLSGHIDDTQGGRLHPSAQNYAQRQTTQRQTRGTAVVANTTGWTRNRAGTTPSLFPHIPSGFINIIP